MMRFSTVAVLSILCVFLAGCQQQQQQTADHPPQVDLKDIPEKPQVLETTVQDAGAEDLAETPADEQDVRAVTPAPPPERTHTMKAGDTLYNLAQKFYGDDKKWKKILAANRDKISDHTDISIGTVLVIPPE